MGYEVAKRVLDVLVSLLLILVLSPLLVVILVAIRLDSVGAAIFRQTRVGRGGREFIMYKFRTMQFGSDESIHRDFMRDLVAGEADSRENEDGEEVYLLDDPRITRIGRMLRRTSLDELPNLFNVLRGEMSLVGPRPPIPYEVEFYDERSRRRLDVKPGMTGLAQVSGRGGLTFSEVVDYDLEYIENRGMIQDLRILVQTLPAVMRRQGV